MFGWGRKGSQRERFVRAGEVIRTIELADGTVREGAWRLWKARVRIARVGGGWVGEEEVEFAGFTVTMDSVKPSEKYLKAIKEFPTPKNITGIRSWFGVVQQVAYAFCMTETMKPFRELLKPKMEFYWDKTLDDLFEKSKDMIIEAVIEGVCGRTNLAFSSEAPNSSSIVRWSRYGIFEVLE